MLPLLQEGHSTCHAHSALAPCAMKPKHLPLSSERHPHYRRVAARSCSLRVRCTAAPSFRTATPADVPVIRQMILRERMNPLGIAPERYTVAVDAAGSLLGFGQLEQKDGYLELRSMVVAGAAR